MTPLATANFAHPARNTTALRIEPGMTVVDFGAGSGHYALEIAQWLANSGHVYAIDVQQELLRRIKNEAHKKGYSNVEIIWGDVEAPGGSKIADSHVDLVLVSNLLFQVQDKKAMLAEARRILRKNGRLAIIDWKESFGGTGPHKKEVVTQARAIELAEAAGFEKVDEFDAGAHHYGLFFVPR